jgi:hypothetical protein
MATDYKVRFRAYRAVADIAHNARKRLGIDHYFTFNIVKAIRHLLGKELDKLGVLHLNIFDHDNDPIAYVTFNPPTLHVHREVWEDAESGEPKSRFILAHELGHLLMHSHYRQAFSEDEGARLKFIQPEESAESQANWFAASFLAPDYLARLCNSESELCLQFDFPRDFVSIKFDNLKRHAPSYSGEACSTCGNFTLTRDAGRLKCETCEFLVES